MDCSSAMPLISSKFMSISRSVSVRVLGEKVRVWDEVVSNFHRNMVSMKGKENPRGNLVAKKGARYATFQDDVGSLVRGTHWFTVAQLHRTYLYRRSEGKRDRPTGGVRTDTDQLVQHIEFTTPRIFLEVLEEKYKNKNFSFLSFSSKTSWNIFLALNPLS